MGSIQSNSSQVHTTVGTHLQLLQSTLSPTDGRKIMLVCLYRSPLGIQQVMAGPLLYAKNNMRHCRNQMWEQHIVCSGQETMLVQQVTAGSLLYISNKLHHCRSQMWEQHIICSCQDRLVFLSEQKDSNTQLTVNKGKEQILQLQDLPGPKMFHSRSLSSNIFLC